LFFEGQFDRHREDIAVSCLRLIVFSNHVGGVTSPYPVAVDEPDDSPAVAMRSARKGHRHEAPDKRTGSIGLPSSQAFAAFH